MSLKMYIRGVVYHDTKNDCIVVPMRSGMYSAADCICYYKKKELINIFDKDHFHIYKNNYYQVSGKKYYYGSYFVKQMNDNWEILSDITTLELKTDETEFS